LKTGGAELALDRLIGSDARFLKSTIVVSLSDLGPVGVALRNRGITVYALGMTSFFSTPVALFKLISILRIHKPLVVQTWMYHADFLGGIAARFAGVHAIVWGVRSVGIPQGPTKATYWLVRLCALTSTMLPHHVICCAQTAKAAHVSLGYPSQKLSVIANGFDFSHFDRYQNSRISARAALGMTANDLVIGVVGRFDPLKDFGNFISAMSIVVRDFVNVKVMMVGRGNSLNNDVLCKWIKDADLSANVSLWGERNDVAYCLSAMDIFCLPSKSEAFPNVLVEAMAMALPCVSTNAGDAAVILAKEEYVVPTKNSVALAAAIKELCLMSHDERVTIGMANSQRVRKVYGLDAMRKRYFDIYSCLIPL
jgi:glycosyltransferase involved in cell wall biosynthesis